MPGVNFYTLIMKFPLFLVTVSSELTSNAVSCFVVLDRTSYAVYQSYVCLLGANELAVQKAKTEITRLIKEELIRLVSISFLLKSITSAGYPADFGINRSLCQTFILH